MNSSKLLTATQAAVDAAISSTATEPLTVVRARSLATLWAGYGTVTEAVAEADAGIVSDDDEDSAVSPRERQLQLIIKTVQPPASASVGGDDPVGHERKCRSYQVEAQFYRAVAPRLPRGSACHLPRCLGAATPAGGGAGSLQLVLRDLRPAFPVSQSTLDEAHTLAALEWLAAFHAVCWGADAATLGLWPQGTYWHLGTRLQELEGVGSDWAALRCAAHDIDARLRASPYRTLVHGDFKPANLLFTAAAPGGGSSNRSGASSGGVGKRRGTGDGSGSGDGEQQPQQAQQQLECAAYDLQYVGGGSGLQDVAYLLCSGASPRLLGGGGDRALLRHYHACLMQRLAQTAEGGGGGVGCAAAASDALRLYTFDAMLGDYHLAVADYVRFMAGWGMWGNSAWAASAAREALRELGLEGGGAR